MSNQIKALGEYVIMKAVAESAGTEIKSEMGLIIGVRDTGEIPLICEVFSIGDAVPEGYVSIGDKSPMPEGHMKNVPHPLVAQRKAKPKDIPEKFISVHYKNIPCVYKDL